MKKIIHLAGIVIAIAALYFTFKNISWEQLKDAFLTADYIHVIWGVIVVVLTFLARAVRWKYLVRPLNSSIQTSELMAPLMIGFLGNLLPARAGEFIRAYILGKKFGLSFSASFGTVFIERIFDMVILLLLIIWVMLFQSDLFASITVLGDVPLESVVVKFGWIALISVGGLVLFCFMLLKANAFVMNIIGTLTKPLPDGIKLKIHELLHAFVEGLTILKDLRASLTVLALSAVVWFLIVLAYYPFLYALNIEYLPFSSTVMLAVMTAVFITIFPTPGYLGSFQLACVVALYNIYNVPEPIAVSFGVLTWFVNMALIGVWGTYYILKENLSISELSSRGEDTL